MTGDVRNPLDTDLAPAMRRHRPFTAAGCRSYGSRRWERGPAPPATGSSSMRSVGPPGRTNRT